MSKASGKAKSEISFNDEVTYPLYPKNSTEINFHANMVKLNETTLNLEIYSDKNNGRGVKVIYTNCFLKLRQLFGLVKNQELVNVKMVGNLFEVKAITVIEVI